MKDFIFSLMVLCLVFGNQVLASPYASEVIEHSADLDGSGPYNDPQNVLGQPATINGDCGCVSMVCAAWGYNTLTTINDGSYIIVKFDHQVKDDLNNPFGVDFIVFGNAFHPADGPVDWTTDMEVRKLLSGGLFAEPVLVAVSQNGTDWYEYSSGPYGDTKFPTNAKKWDRINHQWGNLLDFTKPVDPSIDPAIYGGMSVADVIDQYYAPSGGGTGFDLEPSGYDSILYIKVYGSNGGEIDAFSDVSPDDTISVEELVDKSMPKQYSLSQNYPNPFNLRTTISFRIPENSLYTSLKIYNLQGQLVRILEQGYKSPGYYKTVWDGKDSHNNPVVSGLYIYKLETEHFSKTRKMLILR